MVQMMRRVSKDEGYHGLMVLPAMPTGRANAHPMTGSASSVDGVFIFAPFAAALRRTAKMAFIHESFHLAVMKRENKEPMRKLGALTSMTSHA
jgi:hypothetical protein